MSQAPSMELDVGIDHTASVADVLRTGLTTVKRAQAIMGIFLLAAVLVVILRPVQSLVHIVAAGVAAPIAFRALGGEPSDGNSMGVRVLLLIVASLIQGIIVVLGLILLVLPGVFLAIRFSLIVPVIMLEDTGPIQALSRSYEITRGHGWTILGVLVVFFLIGFAMALPIVFIGSANAAATDNPVVFETYAALGTGLITAVVGPVAIASTVVMYGIFEPATSAEE